MNSKTDRRVYVKANNGKLVCIENDTPDLTELSWSNFAFMNIDGAFYR